MLSLQFTPWPLWGELVEHPEAERSSALHVVDSLSCSCHSLSLASLRAHLSCRTIRLSAAAPSPRFPCLLTRCKRKAGSAVRSLPPSASRRVTNQASPLSRFLRDETPCFVTLELTGAERWIWVANRIWRRLLMEIHGGAARPSLPQSLVLSTLSSAFCSIRDPILPSPPRLAELSVGHYRQALPALA